MEKQRKTIAEKFNLFIDNERRSINLEKACFNSVLSQAKKRGIVCKWENKNFNLLYKNKIKTILYNINPKYNTELHNKITTGEIKTTEIPFMNHQELSPEQWKDTVELIIKKNKSKYEVNMEAATEEFTCYKCKKNKCTYYELQTRSADEPMTTFVSCLVCGNHWKC